MSKTWDLSDVPTVTSEDLALPMRMLIDAGRGLVLLKGLSDDDLRAITPAIWQHLDAARASAVLTRFRCLVDAFSARRLRQLFLDRGHALIDPAIRYAATARLNARWGFNLHRFASTLAQRDETAESRTEPRLPAAVLERLRARAAQQTIAIAPTVTIGYPALRNTDGTQPLAREFAL
jgi:hypothetical protein